MLYQSHKIYSHTGYHHLQFASLLKVSRQDVSSQSLLSTGIPDSFQSPDNKITYNSIVISLSASQSTIEAFKSEIRQLSSVDVVSQLEAYSVPGMDPWVEDYTIDKSSNTKLIEELGVDQYYLEALQIDLVVGEFFDSRKHRSQRTFVVNKAFVDHFGWQADEAVGKELDVYGFGGRIVGVTDNFFFDCCANFLFAFNDSEFNKAVHGLVCT